MLIDNRKTEKGTAETVSLSVKGVLASAGQAIKDVSEVRKINQSVLLRELLNGPMTNFIHVFCLKSHLVASLDQDLAHYLGGQVIPSWGNTGWNQYDACYRELLDIHTEEDLTRILLQNTQFLRLRASQCMNPGMQFMGGTSMYAALFCEVACRDENTIEAHWANITRYWGPWYRRQDYYYQINQLRSARNLPAANTLTEAHAKGVYSQVAVLKANIEQEGLSQVLLTLRTENTRPLPRDVFSGFKIPFCQGHFLTPDPGYGSVYRENNLLSLGFRFIEETSSLHCYTLSDDSAATPQTLSEVANALVTIIDEKLRPYASTFPLSRK